MSAEHTGRLDRAGALGGIGFTVLGLASAFVVPQAPAVDDPVAEIRDYLTDHDAALGVSVVLSCAAMLALAVFVAMLHRRISAVARGGSAPGTFLVAGTAAVTLGLLGGVLQAALVQRVVPDADDSTVGALYAVWDIVAFTGPPLAFTAALVAAAAVLARDATFPRWISAVAAIALVMSVVSVVADLTTDRGVSAGLDLAGFLVANVWIVATSVVTLRGGTAGATAPRPDATAQPASPATV